MDTFAELEREERLPSPPTRRNRRSQPLEPVIVDLLDDSPEKPDTIQDSRNLLALAYVLPCHVYLTSFFVNTNNNWSWILMNSSTTPGIRTRAKAKKQRPDPSRILFYYPFQGSSRIPVICADLERLRGDEFLNDSIIDFYLRYIVFFENQLNVILTNVLSFLFRFVSAS